MSVLRKALLANGVFSTIAGLVAIVFASGLAAYLGISSTLLHVIGGGVAVFGLAILWKARREPISRGFALFVVIADLSWVLGAAVVLAIPSSMENKWLLAVVTLTVAVFAVAQSRGSIRESAIDPRRIVTQVEVAAPPEVVWDRLTRLESFSEWNPFMVEASGLAEAGQAVSVRMQQPEGSVMTFRPTVTVFDKPARFEWLGKLWVTGLFDGRHRFDLAPTSIGTNLTHSEEFSGLLVPLLWKSLDTKTRSGFEAMNQALKSASEGSVRNST